MNKYSSLATLAIAVVGAAALAFFFAHRPQPKSFADPQLPADAVLLPDGASHWDTHGFVAMVPPIRLPVDHARRGRTQVFIYVPDGRSIDVTWLGPDGRPRPADADDALPKLVFPDGTIADRVEYRRVNGVERVVDVRGTRFVDGAEEFHVYRPARGSGGNAMELYGYAWIRGRLDEREKAERVFRTAMEAGAGFSLGERGHAEDQRARSIDRFAALLDCESCHAHGKPESFEARTTVPRRATDAQGMYVMQSVLSDSAPLETYRPLDPNAEQPYVRVDCPSPSPASSDAKPTWTTNGMPIDDDRELLIGPKGSTEVRCPNGQVPRVTYDSRAALTAGDPHAKRVCASRRWLAERMTESARAAFADPLGACRVRTSRRTASDSLGEAGDPT